MLRSLWPSVSWRQVLVSLCEMALVAGCAGASVSKVQTPLPADVRVWKPPADTPEPVAAFSGVWAGRFGEWVAHGLGAGSSSVYHTLVVENIGYTGLDTYRASVIYSWGPDVSRPPGFARTSGMIGTDGVLRLSTFGNGRTGQLQDVSRPDNAVSAVRVPDRNDLGPPLAVAAGELPLSGRWAKADLVPPPSAGHCAGGHGVRCGGVVENVH